MLRKIFCFIFALTLIGAIGKSAYSAEFLFDLATSADSALLTEKDDPLFQPVYVSLRANNYTDDDYVFETKDAYRVDAFILVDQEIDLPMGIPCKQMVGWMRPTKIIDIDVTNPTHTVHSHTVSELAFGELSDMFGPNGYAPLGNNLQGVFPAGCTIPANVTYILKTPTLPGTLPGGGSLSKLITFRKR